MAHPSRIVQRNNGIPEGESRERQAAVSQSLQSRDMRGRVFFPRKRIGDEEGVAAERRRCSARAAWRMASARGGPVKKNGASYIYTWIYRALYLTNNAIRKKKRRENSVVLRSTLNKGAAWITFQDGLTIVRQLWIAHDKVICTPTALPLPHSVLRTQCYCFLL